MIIRTVTEVCTWATSKMHPTSNNLALSPVYFHNSFFQNVNVNRCIGKNPHTTVVLLSLKSLGYLLRWDLPSMRRCAPVVGRHVLGRLIRGGVGGIRGEMGQACFKALSILFKNQVHVFEAPLSGGVNGAGVGVGVSNGGGQGEQSTPAAPAPAGGAGGAAGRKRRRRGGSGGGGGGLFGLSAKQMRALLVVLQMAVAETEHQNATFGLIKAIVSKKIMLPEVGEDFVCVCCMSIYVIEGMGFLYIFLSLSLSRLCSVCLCVVFCLVRDCFSLRNINIR